VAKQGEDWLAARANVPNRAIVLDVDDTTLTTWNYELFSNWDFNPTTNGNFVGLTSGAFTGNMFPGTPACSKKSTGPTSGTPSSGRRGDSQHLATVANLQNDAGGFSNITLVNYSGATVPRSMATRRRPRSTPGIPCWHTSQTVCSRSRDRHGGDAEPISRVFEQAGPVLRR
jgi:hypothetical protein